MELKFAANFGVGFRQKCLASIYFTFSGGLCSVFTRLVFYFCVLGMKNALI